MLRFVLNAIVCLVLLSGCAQSPPASSEIQSNYTSSVSPPSGYGRVYIFAPTRDTLLAGTVSIPGKVTVKRGDGQEVKAGDVGKDKFVAFDSKPGFLYIKFNSMQNYTSPGQEFEIESGKFLALKPVIQPNGGEFGLIGIAIASASNENEQKFAHLDKSDVRSLMEGKTLTAISPEATGTVRQSAR